MKNSNILQKAINQHAELTRNCGMLQDALRCQHATEQAEYDLTVEEYLLKESVRNLRNYTYSASNEIKTLQGKLEKLKTKREFYMKEIPKSQKKIGRIKREGFLLEDSESKDGSALKWAEKQHKFFCWNAEIIRTNERKIEQEIETLTSLLSDADPLIALPAQHAIDQGTNVIPFPSQMSESRWEWEMIFDQVIYENAEAILAQIRLAVTPCASLSQNEYVDEVRTALTPDDLYCAVFNVIGDGGTGLGELDEEPFFFWLETNTREVTKEFKELRKVLCDNLLEIVESTSISQPESRWEWEIAA